MSSIFQRLLQGVFGGRPNQPEAAQPDAAGRRKKPAGATSGPPPPASEAPKGETAVSALVSVGARRPLIGSNGTIAGFEFRIDSDIQRRLRQRANHRAQAAYVSALLTSAHLMAKTGRIGFARVPADWLAQVTDMADAAGAWIGIEQSANVEDLTPEQSESIAQAVLRLRAGGAKVGWDVTAVFGSAPDFVLLHQAQAPMGAVLEAMKTWPQGLKKLPTLVTDIASVDDIELALDKGITYVSGALAPAEPADGATEVAQAPPEFLRVAQVLHQLTTGVDNAVIVKNIKSGVGLSYRLLCRLKIASSSQLNSVSSIEQAVLLLGRNELYRWLSLLLLESGGRRKVSPAWQEITLWRSRLLELLAIERKEASPGQFFTLGLASMVGSLLKISLAEVVSTLNLPEPARQALLEEAGPWHAYLQIALQVETQRLGGSSALADQFGGSARVAQLADEAWTWAWEAEHANREGLAAGPAAG